MSIASDAFSGCSNIETLTLDIATVGDCFAGLSNLKTIVLRDPVTTVNDDAFTGCTGVTDLTIGKSLVNESDVVFAPFKNSIVNLTANCKNIYKWFTGSTSLLSVSLGKNVQTIGNDAFNNCQKLATTNFSEGLVSVGNKAFYYCRGLQAALLPSTVNSIGESAFQHCDNMKQVNIPEGVKLIQNLTFNNCGITSLTIPSTVTDITLHAFSSCVNLEEIIIPATVKNIGQYVFAHCTSVKHISIPDSNLEFQIDENKDKVEGVWKKYRQVEGAMQIVMGIASYFLSQGIKVACYANGRDIITGEHVAIDGGAGVGQLDMIGKALARIDTKKEARPFCKLFEEMLMAKWIS